MKKWFLGAIAMTIASFFNLSLRADEVVMADNAGGCNPCACNACCDTGCGSWVADLEATFLRYHRNDDLNTDNIFGFEISPRLSVGYVGSDGLGARIRWWDYSHNNTGTLNNVANRTLDVDTFNLDFELFESVQLSCCTSVELSAGIRYNDFAETITTAGAVTQVDSFSGYGGLFGLKAKRDVSLGGNVYARWNTAIMMSDHTNSRAAAGTRTNFDVVQTQTELGLGYEYATCLSTGGVLTLRAGVEWSHWTDYTTDLGGTAQNRLGNEDVGFGGFVLGVGLNY